MAHALGEVAGVVGVDLRLVRGARDGDVGKAGADELRVGPRVHVDEYSLGGDSLGAVGCDGVAMVEVPHAGGIEGDGLLFAVHLDSELAPVEVLDCSKVAVGNSKLSRRRGELDAIAFGEVAMNFLVCRDSLQPARIVGAFLPVPEAHGEAVVLGLNRGDGGVAAALDSLIFTALAVVDDVSSLVLCRPLSIGSGHFGTWNENSERMIFRGDDSRTLQLDPHGSIEFPAAGIVRRNDDGSIWPGGVLLRDRLYAFRCVWNFGDAALLLHESNADGCLVLR